MVKLERQKSDRLTRNSGSKALLQAERSQMRTSHERLGAEVREQRYPRSPQLNDCERLTKN
jgi:hypothetical protein